MIDARSRCSWCRGWFRFDPARTVLVEHAGETYVYCSDDCRIEGVAQLADGGPHESRH